MSEVDDLDRALQQTRDDYLPAVGVPDSLFREVVSHRLLIERLGEAENNYWWDSLVMSEFGRDSLEEVAPRTTVKARLDLAQRIGRKTERERLSEDTVSLFHLGSAFEHRLKGILSEITGFTDFERIETLDMEFTTTGWTDDVGIEGELTESGSGDTIEIGTIPQADLNSIETVVSASQELFTAYGASTTNELRVPYLSIEQ